MKNSLFGLLMVVAACQYNNGNPAKQPSNENEPKSPHGPLGLMPQDDIQIVVNPAWHDGKRYNLTQSLKANAVEKGKINLGTNNAETP